MEIVTKQNFKKLTRHCDTPIVHSASGNMAPLRQHVVLRNLAIRLLREVHLKGVPPQIVVQMWRKSVLSDEENVRARTGGELCESLITGCGNVQTKGVSIERRIQRPHYFLVCFPCQAPRELVACWPTAKFHARLEAMRDIFHELCMKRKEHQALPTAWQSGRPLGT